ncbi:uncharacterized protein LACBIDRAFT_332507 [Laccaria bicolor S238N-H82]|uniref:Spindle assembly checkpoint component MAD1 n=1 Tax=Laccaria bicolor (strain S238N-H82 / ATCC MYA-4686) TaxID=486041 RepID=B0DSZ0_LACBS|nr:uncharacterized protein LACBIDRAFT_332507 [Laccaria bicolor S238N-H82]EDR02403.1 predicted protein [Laccaria bicolor S238N-H82]|eukprot:XP_001887080.1 predicted protein [Laccaria bicolor S238N-H82]
MSHASLERQLLMAQTTNTELEKKLLQKDLQIEKLERDRRWLSDREKEEREEKDRERETHDEDKRRSDAELRSMRSSLTATREELVDLQDAHSALSRSTSQTIASQKSQIATLTRQTTILEEELSHAKATAEDRSKALTELQLQHDERPTSSDVTSDSSDDMRIVREELHRQAAYHRTLESTNAHLTAELAVLRERHASVEVLREEKRGLEKKLSVLEEMRERVVRLEAQVEAGRREREAWAKTETDSVLSQTLSDLRLTHARLLEEHGGTVALLRSREAEILDLTRREEEALVSVGELQDALRKAKDEVSRHQTRAALADREVGFTKALLASYKAEEEVPMAPDSQLESLLEEYKTTNAALLRQVKENSFTLELDKERQEKAALQQELDQHFTKIEALEQTLFELSGEIAGGRHVPPKTRVLCLKENPDQQWVDLRQAAMDRLKSENEALLKRLKDLEDTGVRLGGAEEDLVPRESWDQVVREKQDLEGEVKQKEKRLLRLQQIFTSKSAEFREAIASILGLKLAFYPNGQVRVTSTYDLNASFVFQPTSNTGGMKMQLVAQGEGGPQDLPNLMQYWIETEQCPPGFMASVTLECYDNWKRSGAGVANG